MITKTIQINEISVDELVESVAEKLFHKIEAYLKASESKTEDILLTRKETAKFLQVSEQALHMWNKKKILLARRIGNRVYYRKQDILDLTS